MPLNQPTPDQDPKPEPAPPGEPLAVEATMPPAALAATDAPGLPGPVVPEASLAEVAAAAEPDAPVDASAPDGPADAPAPDVRADAAAPDVPADGAAPDAAAAVPDLPPAECAARLAALFPALFAPGAAKPLKLRIQADIQQRAPGVFNKKSLSVFLHRYTTSTAYLRAMVAAPHRTDLDGSSAGEVADEHRQAATAELERRRTLHEERRVAEREAQRKAEDERRKALQAQWPARPTPGAVSDGPDAGVAAGAGARDARPLAPARPRPAQGARREAPDAARPRARPDAPRRPADESRRPIDTPRRPPDQLRPRRDEPRTAPVQPGVPPPTEDAGRRERAVLLRAYESTTLTRANFCALKRLTEAELNALLAQARQEAPPDSRQVSARQRR